MKATDLMIGDWVCVRSNDGEDTHNFKIRTISEIGVNSGSGFVGFDEDLEPIPLTEEILESNNFQSKEDPYSHRKFFFLGKNEYNLDVYFDNGTIILVEADYEPTVYAYMCDCKYVHELQHLLKGLEIEKEIII